ncbi:protein saal1 [Arctopsyche grandis]|uniref:protein saal1 n=1 Tax=Arctopsyche grandis TaxID=121162 RepID=UPI00406D9730
MKNGTRTVEEETNKQSRSPESIAADAVKGDVIGSTAYSQRFVLNCLIKLTDVENVESASEFIEKDLCTMWDMTTEKDVSKFLIEHDAVEIFNAILISSNNNRLLEVILGTVSNMSCHKDVTVDIKQKRAFAVNIFTHLKSADPLLLVQVLRFALTIIYNDSTDMNFWLACLRDGDFPSSLRFILENCANEDVLTNSLETLNCICSACNDDTKNTFIKLFIDEHFVTSLLTGFQEILNCIKETSSINKETEERCYVIFLAIIWAVINFDECLPLFNEESNEKLFTHANMIIETAWSNENDGILDIMEYVTGISSALNFPFSNSSIKICVTFMRVWKDLIDSYDNKINSDFEDPDFIDNMKKEITPVLTNYFVRIVKLWPLEKVNELFKDFETKHVFKLKSSIEECIENKIVDTYYADVCFTLIESINK